MFERMKAVFCVDQQDGIPICPDCKVQIGEGEDHCLNCALYECEIELDALKKALIRNDDEGAVCVLCGHQPFLHDDDCLLSKK